MTLARVQSSRISSRQESKMASGCLSKCRPRSMPKSQAKSQCRHRSRSKSRLLPQSQRVALSRIANDNKHLYILLFLIILNLHTTSALLSNSKNLHMQRPYSLSSSAEIQDIWYKLPGFKERECFAVQSSVIVRNGINLPSEKIIKEVINIHQKLIEAMDLDVNKELYEWNNPFSIDKTTESVSKHGKHEQHTLGKHIALRLLSLYGSEDIGDVTFLSSSQIAPKESSKSFYNGFFDGIHGPYEEDDDEFNTDVDDKLLRFFNRCSPSAEKEFKNKNNEFHKFLQSEHIGKIASKITDLLNIKEGILTNEDVWHIYLFCGYEEANFGSSPWCALLNAEDMDVLAYLGDLKLYHDVGYGTKQSWPHGCLLLSEIFTAMEEAIDEIEGVEINEDADGYTVGLFAFTEAETIATFMSALGLFNDTSPLRADNFETHTQRHFHGGDMIPFSANVALLLYECAPEDYRTAETSYYFKLFVNEKAVLIPGCSSLHCPFQQVVQHYQFLTKDCHSKKLCSNQNIRDEL